MILEVLSNFLHLHSISLNVSGLNANYEFIIYVAFFLVFCYDNIYLLTIKGYKMFITCLDLEGVLVPEIWIAFAEETGIKELRLTTREIGRASCRERV